MMMRSEAAALIQLKVGIASVTTRTVAAQLDGERRLEGQRSLVGSHLSGQIHQAGRHEFRNENNIVVTATESADDHATCRKDDSQKDAERARKNGDYSLGNPSAY
jgi:hypothetical protein